MKQEKKAQEQNSALTPQESAAELRLKHDLIETEGILAATRGRHAIHCLTVIGTIEATRWRRTTRKRPSMNTSSRSWWTSRRTPRSKGCSSSSTRWAAMWKPGSPLAELIAGVSKPSATLVLGGGHSIGIPLAVSARRSFVVPTATMTVHPVRHSGMVLGVPQTLRYFEQMQERIVGFVASHSSITAKRFTQLMHNTGELVMDMGTVLNGQQAVEEGLIDALGGLGDALQYLYREIESGGGGPRR